MTISTWIKVGAVALGAAACFLGGYQVAAALYGRDIAQLREDYAVRAQLLEELARGLRDENTALRRQLSRADGDSCAPCRTALTECLGLLDRGAELLAGCARVRLEDAADIDAIRTVMGSGRQK